MAYLLGQETTNLLASLDKLAHRGLDEGIEIFDRLGDGFGDRRRGRSWCGYGSGSGRDARTGRSEGLLKSRDSLGQLDGGGGNVLESRGSCFESFEYVSNPQAIVRRQDKRRHLCDQWTGSRPGYNGGLRRVDNLPLDQRRQVVHIISRHLDGAARQ